MFTGYWNWPGAWHMWGDWWIFPLLMMALMVAACAFLMSRMMSGHRASYPDSALKLLGERFAKGEISKDEFEEKRAALVRPI